MQAGAERTPAPSTVFEVKKQLKKSYCSDMRTSEVKPSRLQIPLRSEACSAPQRVMYHFWAYMSDWTPKDWERPEGWHTEACRPVGGSHGKGPFCHPNMWGGISRDTECSHHRGDAGEILCGTDTGWDGFGGVKMRSGGAGIGGWRRGNKWNGVFLSHPPSQKELSS